MNKRHALKAYRKVCAIARTGLPGAEVGRREFHAMVRWIHRHRSDIAAIGQPASPGDRGRQAIIVDDDVIVW